MIRRRELIALGSAAALLPLNAARAQLDKDSRVRRIGVLMGFSEADEVWQNYLTVFKQRLADFGWTDGRNLKLEIRFAGEDSKRTADSAKELVAQAPDVLFVSTNPVVSAVLQVTDTIPIVFTWVSDSLGSGYVKNLARPAGNITGFHNFEPVVGGKWLGILKQIAPEVRRVAVVHVPEIKANVAFIPFAQEAAATLGVTVSPAGVRNAADIERVLAEFAKEPGGGLIVTPSPLTATRRDVLANAAARNRLPAIYPFRFYCDSGGLVSYGSDQLETVREAASYVDRILRGTSPGELPVQLPTKFSLAINLKTAKALGITVPNSMLLLTDDVIE